MFSGHISPKRSSVDSPARHPTSAFPGSGGIYDGPLPARARVRHCDCSRVGPRHAWRYRGDGGRRWTWPPENRRPLRPLARPAHISSAQRSPRPGWSLPTCQVCCSPGWLCAGSRHSGELPRAPRLRPGANGAHPRCVVSVPAGGWGTGPATRGWPSYRFTTDRAWHPRIRGYAVVLEPGRIRGSCPICRQVVRGLESPLHGSDIHTQSVGDRPIVETLAV